MAELNTKKAWVKPEVVSLDVEKTLGGIIVNQNESFIIQSTQGPLHGTS
jgi:hypothetical protein